MPQRYGAGAQSVPSDDLNERSLSARAEELRARRDRLMQLRISTSEEEVAEAAGSDEAADGPSLAELLAVARVESEHARHQARSARRVAWIAATCMAVMVAGGAWGSLKVFRKLNRDTMELERVTSQVRTQRELSGLIAEERDILRADLLDAREARARAEGQLSARGGDISTPARDAAGAQTATIQGR